MKRLILMLIIAALGPSEPALSESSSMQFVALDVYLQTDERVAAWQFELADRGGRSRIVGIENGGSPAFSGAPYYDRTAVDLGQSDRVIVAAYSLADEESLPTGRVRLATVHLIQHETDKADFELTLIQAVRHDGTKIDASISSTRQTGSQQ